MSTHTKKDDFCLECHWEAFHIDGKDSQDASETSAQPQWNCPDDEHHTLLTHCAVDEEVCCDIDECSVGCPSVCDGFVDCDTVTVCSVSHCDDKNCQSGEPVCFDEHCFTANDQNGQPTDHNALDSLLGLGPSLQLEACDLLPSMTIDHSQIQPAKTTEHGPPHLADSAQSTDALFAPYSTAINHCHPHPFHHFHCHPFPRDSHNSLVNAPFPVQNEVNPADVFQMLGMCPSISACPDFHAHNDHSCEALGKLDDNTADSFSCFHLPHIAHESSKAPVHPHVDVPIKGPCRSHHRCRIHPHSHHIHPYGPYSPYSRHSRSSVSSQLISSPGETPPPLEGGISSVLTSPESLVDSEVYACKWTSTTILGAKTTCGATFSDPCALQDHLIANHMGTIDGSKGTGYYCCWEGCHRPDAPFSQKSKLQGHFLTHSNYKNFKCSVCGKLFARQATLERHERSHRGEKPYKCADCGKSFTDSSELKTHSRTHTGEKPFKCTYPGCNFQTGDSSNMSSHRLTHRERKHKCTYLGCSKSFTRPDQLKRHIRTTHKSDSPIFPSPIIDQFAYPLGV
ncbi:C2H2-type zinc finger protein [Aspergillus clavatus NRRL 1]|uniref:C2H2 transcription factor, putative n=1 Tax=Aspergillus clavatus (strain ATCC 1007 / CBS 513.65 / DSM 816 / NCTC 3887 / NRRL 1 / QM 1276 / 107) TaxID=344612 RepID=A1CQA7_ASPCL|nr:C2H2 transcription factor, putative [Aspergillus clavatus NRRL 1]EAW07828.1 C2H2 transcription factor, putative [Aspergillus clavatus NRRL 1]